MLFFVGGAARSGKSMLARRLLADERLPYVSLDVLKMGLVRAFPRLGIDPNAGAMITAVQLWPLVREMSHSLLADRVSYVFEGELLPKQLADLRDHFPTQVYACFLGYAFLQADDKLKHMRKHTGYPNDWSVEYTDTELLAIIRREIEFSQYVRDECQTYNFPYFDTSHDFVATGEQVFVHIQTFI